MNTIASKLRRAFTLLELMVALSILCLVVLAIYSSWYSIVKGSRTALDAAAAAQRARISLRTVQDAFLCSCMYSQNARYYYILADNTGDFTSVTFVARLPKSFPRSGKFDDLDLRRLNFTVEDGPDSKNQLVLRQNPVFMEPDVDEMEHPLVLARDVSTFLVEFTDPKTGEWVTEWATTNQLPRKVRITVALGHQYQNRSQPVEVMVGTVALPSIGVRPEWQSPVGTLVPPGGGGGQTNVGGRPVNQPGRPPGFNNPNLPIKSP